MDQVFIIMEEVIALEFMIIIHIHNKELPMLKMFKQDHKLDKITVIKDLLDIQEKLDNKLIINTIFTV